MIESRDDSYPHNGEDVANASSTTEQAPGAHFGGRITNTHAAHAEFTSNPPVLIPETPADVGAALTLARAAGRTAYLRSGDRVASSDFVSDPMAAVVSLETFADIVVELQRVTVGPAVTIGDLATALRQRALFLPLFDQPTMSIATAVLGNHATPFPRSVGDRPLWEGVVEADIIPTNPSGPGAIRTLDARGWRKFRATREGVVTRLVLDASRWAKFGKNRWLRAWMVPYSRDGFEVLCERLLGRGAPSKVDLSLRASTDAYGARLVVVRATGLDRVRSERARRFVETALNKAGCQVLWSEKVDGAGAALAAWVGTGLGRAGPGEVHTSLTSSSAWSTKEEGAFLGEIDGLLDAGAWVDLHKGSGRRAFVPASAGVLSTPNLAMTSSTPRTGLATAAALTPLVYTHLGRIIPGFQGEVFSRAVGGSGYQNAIQQYAVSSLDAATVASRMTPRYVAVAKDAADVVCAVGWAADQGLKVVSRSGGHQYCGLSSGGYDTLLVDVQLLDQIVPSATWTSVCVGPGVSLTSLTAALQVAQVSVPHGECPLVNLGGHVQTGGIGHQLRSLGLSVDWVREFRMVSWGAPGGWAERVYPHPIPGQPRPTDQVFAAVLGGGPGSWGILTSITFEVAKDDDPRFTGARACTRTYPYNRSGFAAAVNQLRLWSDMEHNGTLPHGVDLFVSAISGNYALRPGVSLRPAVLLLEATALQASGDQLIRDGVDAVANHVSWWDKVLGGALDLASRGPNGPARLSQIVHHGVRSVGQLSGMPHGREFDLPYKKSLYVTRQPMPPQFCDHFVDLVDRADRHPDLRVVFQGIVGGGKFRETGALNSTRMQHRDALVQLVFDVFYREGFARTAEDFQNELLALWMHFFPAEIGRMFWGTYEDAGTNGAQLDMADPAVQARYYDSQAAYAALRQVKTAVDPGDVFHTTFTVRP